MNYGSGLASTNVSAVGRRGGDLASERTRAVTLYIDRHSVGNDSSLATNRPSSVSSAVENRRATSRARNPSGDECSEMAPARRGL